MKNAIFVVLILIFTSALIGCTGMPDKVNSVSPFSVERYQGKWYEIARLDHSFERGLQNVTADYSLNNDGSIKVLNRGFDQGEQAWSDAEGKAKFVDDKNTGHLKVSFFGPFYSSYVVFGLDQKNYNYAYVSGYNNEYLWLLSRTPTITNERKIDFINAAKARGFDTDSLIWVTQTPL